ncbi:hypothetical protein BOX15_Mlig030544g1, partial [Macrostomum lignano]
PATMSRYPPYGGATSIQSLNEMWAQVKQGIDRIYNMEGISKPQYMKMYTDIYNYCTSVDPARNCVTQPLAKKGKGEARGAKDTGGGARFVGDELYTKLKDDLKARVVDLKRGADGKVGNDLLEYFYTHWSRFRKCSVTVDGIFNYLNRNWVKRECDEGRKNIYFVYQLALNTWKEHWLKPHQAQVIPALMSEIERERRGENILKSAYLKVIIDCYVELGFESDDGGAASAMAASGSPAPASGGSVSRGGSSRSHVGGGGGGSGKGGSSTDRLHFYEEMFERQFLDETEQFYRVESRDFLQQNSVTAYLAKAERRLEEERKRCSDYVHRSTEEKLLARCMEALLAAHLSVFWQEFPALLDADREQDLGRMYRLCSHVQQPHRADAAGGSDSLPVNGLDRLVELFEQYVADRGLEAVKSVSSAVLSSEGQDAKLYVDTILGVHRKYYNLVLQAFSNNRRFVEALDKACMKFINRNELTKLAKNNQKTPELLARYSDALLKKGSKDNVVGDELEDTLTHVMTVFKYIEDKDVFQKFYSRFLSRRLVYNQSVSEDVESSMISKLKENCGFDYTTKLQRMFQDIGASRELNTRFQDFVTKDGAALGLDFEIKVLSSNAWPIHISQGSGVTIPSELERCYTTFDRFYKKTHEGRKLQYSYNYCRGELITNFTKNRYTLQVSTYQIAVLMMYNTETSYTVQDIAATTSIEPQVLQQVLAILVKAKLLTLSSAEAAADAAELAPGTRLALNQDFKNKRLRINLNSQLKCESKQEQEQTSRLVEEDRSYMIQACLVRVMKTRKEMKHQKLVAEVISQLSQFKPSVQQIKKNIDTLIEKEYLQRKSGERDKYEYLA